MGDYRGFCGGLRKNNQNFQTGIDERKRSLYAERVKEKVALLEKLVEFVDCTKLSMQRPVGIN